MHDIQGTFSGRVHHILGIVCRMGYGCTPKLTGARVPVLTKPLVISEEEPVFAQLGWAFAYMDDRLSAQQESLRDES